jgi:hypothetical protein
MCDQQWKSPHHGYWLRTSLTTFGTRFSGSRGNYCFITSPVNLWNTIGLLPVWHTQQQTIVFVVPEACTKSTKIARLSGRPCTMRPPPKPLSGARTPRNLSRNHSVFQVASPHFQWMHVQNRPKETKNLSISRLFVWCRIGFPSFFFQYPNSLLVACKLTVGSMRPYCW